MKKDKKSKYSRIRAHGLDGRSHSFQDVQLHSTRLDKRSLFKWYMRCYYTGSADWNGK
jgi:hypothetical protein